MPKSLTRPELAVIQREADAAAARIARRLQLPVHERDDLRQDLLADLIARLGAFDPSRGKLGAFAGIVMRNRASRILCRFRREHAAVRQEGPIPRDAIDMMSLIPEDRGLGALFGQVTDRFGELDRRLSLSQARDLVPIDFRLALDGMEVPAAKSAVASSTSRSTHYRHRRELRLRLASLGLAGSA